MSIRGGRCCHGGTSLGQGGQEKAPPASRQAQEGLRLVAALVLWSLSIASSVAVSPFGASWQHTHSSSPLPSFQSLASALSSGQPVPPLTRHRACEMMAVGQRGSGNRCVIGPNGNHDSTKVLDHWVALVPVLPEGIMASSLCPAPIVVTSGSVSTSMIATCFVIVPMQTTLGGKREPPGIR